MEKNLWRIKLGNSSFTHITRGPVYCQFRDEWAKLFSKPKSSQYYKEKFKKNVCRIQMNNLISTKLIKEQNSKRLPLRKPFF